MAPRVQQEKGQTTLEYALIIAILSLGMVISIVTFAQGLMDTTLEVIQGLLETSFGIG